MTKINPTVRIIQIPGPKDSHCDDSTGTRRCGHPVIGTTQKKKSLSPQPSPPSGSEPGSFPPQFGFGKSVYPRQIQPHLVYAAIGSVVQPESAWGRASDHAAVDGLEKEARSNDAEP